MAGRRCLRQRPKHAVVLHNVCLFIYHINTMYFHLDEKKRTNGKIKKQHVVFVCVMLIKWNIVVPALVISDINID